MAKETITSGSGTFWSAIATKLNGMFTELYQIFSGKSGGQTITGGTGDGDSLTLKSTAGAGATDAISLRVGNNGAREAVRVSTDGKVKIETDITSAQSGLAPALHVKSYPLGGTGEQWGGVFSSMTTKPGHSNVKGLYGLLTALYHYQPFTIPLWSGIETGGAYVAGAGAVLTKAYGIEISYPVVTDGGSVGTAAGIYINATDATGITTPYAIFSQSVFPSQFSGSIKAPQFVAGPVSAPFETTKLNIATSGSVTSYPVAVYDTALNRGVKLGAYVGSAGGSVQGVVTSTNAVGALLLNPDGGKVGINTTTAPTAALQLPASKAAANTASLKILPGVLATTPVSGNIESDGEHLYWTNAAGERKQLDI